MPLGWPDSLWSAQRVAEVIRRHFSVGYHIEHARKVIRGRFRWSNQKPRRKANQRNAEKIAHRRADELPRIIKEAEDHKAHLVFLDDCGFQLTPV
jgi:transposase